MSLTIHGAGPSLNCFLHWAPLDRCRRPLGRFHFSVFAAEAVAGAVSVPVAVLSKIVTGLLSASFVNALGPILVGRLRPSTLWRTMPASSGGRRASRSNSSE